MRLAREWGCSVEAAKHKMPSIELPAQIALRNKEPGFEQAVNYQQAAGFAAICNLLIPIAKSLGVKMRGAKNYEIDDFMGRKTTRKPKIAKSAEELTTKLHMWAARWNAKFDKVEREKLKRAA